MTDYRDYMNDVWDDFGRLFENDFEVMNKKLSSMFSDFMNAPGVQTYGYTMYQGPDGVPHVREFGNTKAGKGLLAGSPAETYMEPICDVQQDGEVVRATFEIPGVAKEDVNLEGTPSSLTVTVDTEKRKFSKTVALPCDVDMDSAEATCNNGILEVTLKTVKPAETKKKISIS